MSMTIEGVPAFLTSTQYTDLFTNLGLDPKQLVEVRAAYDGIHALVFALDDQGKRRVDPSGRGTYFKHRIFIPVHHEAGDVRTARVTEVSA